MVPPRPKAPPDPSRPHSKARALRILMLAHRIPYPPHTGDKTRAFHIARHLAARHDLTLGFLVDDERDLGGVDELHLIVSDIVFDRLRKPGSLVRGSAGLRRGAHAPLSSLSF